jgi:hypothetical protein
LFDNLWVKYDLCQAAVVAFLILFGGHNAETALGMVRRHQVAKPENLNHDGGWFRGVALKQHVVTQSALGIVDSDGFPILGFSKFDGGDGLVLGLMKSQDNKHNAVLGLLRPARGKVSEDYEV